MNLKSAKNIVKWGAALGFSILIILFFVYVLTLAFGIHLELPSNNQSITVTVYNTHDASLFVTCFYNYTLDNGQQHFTWDKQRVDVHGTITFTKEFEKNKTIENIEIAIYTLSDEEIAHKFYEFPDNQYTNMVAVINEDASTITFIPLPEAKN
jgi:hypothetical protein